MKMKYLEKNPHWYMMKELQKETLHICKSNCYAQVGRAVYQAQFGHRPEGDHFVFLNEPFFHPPPQKLYK